MEIIAGIITAIIKSVITNKIESELSKEIVSVSLDKVSEKSINKIKNFIDEEKSNIEYVLSKKNMKTNGISENNIDFVVAEIKQLFSKIEITNEVLQECNYNYKKLEEFLWNNYCNDKKYIEHESDIKKGLFVIANSLTKILYESNQFERELLIQVSNSVDDITLELGNISNYIKENFDKLDEYQYKIFTMLQLIYEQNEHLDKQNNKVKKINSRTLEYFKKWNQNMFLNNFDKRDENAGINVKLKDVYLKECLPHYKWKENNNPSDDLEKLLHEYIDENDENKMLLILGHPGIGKSTLITWIVANFIDSINNILIYQFASDLKNIDWKNRNHQYDIVQEILNTLNLSYDNLNEKTLIIDGFDEVNTARDRAKILNQLYLRLIK